jgi:CheY-like chemotaxis protein
VAGGWWLVAGGGLASGRLSLAVDRLTENILMPNALQKLPGHNPLASRSRVILVAEDNPLNQKLIMHQLSRLGHSSDLVCDGLQALHAWREFDYGLLLSDIHMPLMDGYQLTRAIRAEEVESEHLPILALTANAMHGEDKRCIAAGMDDFLTKPVSLEILANLVDTWLPPAESEFKVEP